MQKRKWNTKMLIPTKEGKPGVTGVCHYLLQRAWKIPEWQQNKKSEEGDACVKDIVRDRSILECVRNNARQHLSKNILILTKAQHDRSHTSEVMEWHVMYSGVPMERIKSIPEDHFSFHNCYALYKNISNFIFNISIICST